MASSVYLLNTVSVMVAGLPVTIQAGSLLTDSSIITGAQAVGGATVPSYNGTVAAAAKLVQSLRTSKAVDEATISRIMMGAAVQSALAGASSLPLQTTTYLDALKGNDANTGDKSAPLATVAAVVERLTALGIISAPTTPATLWIQIVGDALSTDGLALNDVKLGAAGRVIWLGTRTTQLTSTCTAYADVDKTNGVTRGGVATLFTDSSVASYTPYVGMFARNTTAGARVDQTLTIFEDNGAHGFWSHECNKPTFGSPGVSPSLTVTKGVFSPGDTYVIETLSKLWLTTDIESNTMSLGTIFFQDIDFQSAQGIAIDAAVTLSFVRCRFTASVSLTGGVVQHPSFSQCFFAAGCFINDGLHDFRGGGAFKNPFNGAGVALVGSGGIARFDFGFTCWRCPVRLLKGGVVIGSLAVFNAVNANGEGAGLQIGDGTTATEVGPGCTATIHPFLTASAFLYGSGNATAGVNIGSGSLLSYTASQIANITITGPAGPPTKDFSFANGFKATSVDESGATPVFASQIDTTWDALAAAVGVAGFGGHAHDYAHNAHIVQHV